MLLAGVLTTPQPSASVIIALLNAASAFFVGLGTRSAVDSRRARDIGVSIGVGYYVVTTAILLALNLAH